jgi:predicted metal-binding membrane protein
MTERTGLECLLLRDRWLIGGALLLVIGLSWAWIAPMAWDMYGPMTGASAWMMTKRWDLTHQLLLFGMWTVMMIGMMLPSATPALFLYASVVRKDPDVIRAPAHVYAFGAGYLLIWTAFSLAATILQLLLNQWLLLSSMMELKTRWLGALLLVLAGIYQITPLKRACLQSCRFPLVLMTRHWKRGITGGLWLGILHGVFCLGCCWALMLLLFVGGVMNLWWIGALTVFVLVEKLTPLGRHSGLISGLLLVALGIWAFLRGQVPR